MSNLKIGIVARCDNGGLGNLTYDFWKNMPEITKELVISAERDTNDLYRYPKGIISNGFPTLEEIDSFLKDIDMVLIFETPYNWNIILEAKKRNIKTVIMPMYEWTAEEPHIHPDLYICPSKLDYDYYREYPSKYLPVPIDRKQFPFELRKEAKTFLFNNGAGGSLGRNGTVELLQAIPMVKSDVKFLINSQRLIPEIKDKRVEVRIGNIKNRNDLFKGDVFLFPHKFNGLSLPIQEALSCGMPVLSTNIYPHNDYLPREWLFEPAGFEKKRIGPLLREIDMAVLDPKKIAEKIDKYANKNITEDSKKAEATAQKISWKKLYPEYIKTFEELCEL